MRAKVAILGIVMLGALAVVVRADCNETQCEDNGVIVYGTGLGDTVPIGSEFIDGKRIDISAHAGTSGSGEPVWLWYNGTQGSVAMRVRFYTDSSLSTEVFVTQGTPCTYSQGFTYANPQHCDAPPGAAYAYAGLVQGTIVNWHFLYRWG